LTFWGPVQNQLAVSNTNFRGLAVNEGRATSEIQNSLLVITGFADTAYHFYELSQKPAGQERSAAIIGEVNNVASSTATIFYAVAVNTQAPQIKAVAAAGMAAANATGGSLQVARAPLSN
jgi:hypothetical protein